MKKQKARRILAVIALVFMAVFSVTLVLTFVSPGMLHGAVGYAALVSGLSGVGLYLVTCFALKPDKTDEGNEGETKGDGDAPDEKREE